MGHANISNIGTFFINRLYAKGTLTITEGVTAMVGKGETVHASEGEYEDEGMLSFALESQIGFWLDPSSEGYRGREPGPFIEPMLSIWFGKKSALSWHGRKLLKILEEQTNATALPDAETTYLMVADKIEEDGQTEWAAHLRILLRQRELLEQFKRSELDNWDMDEKEGEYALFDAIRWRFAPGWRKRFKEVR